MNWLGLCTITNGARVLSAAQRCSQGNKLAVSTVPEGYLLLRKSGPVCTNGSAEGIITKGICLNSRDG